MAGLSMNYKIEFTKDVEKAIKKWGSTVFSVN